MFISAQVLQLAISYRARAGTCSVVSTLAKLRIVVDDTGVFRALADPTRRQILQDLRGGELSAGDIASRFTISAPSISRHLGVLKIAGLISERRDANRIFYSLVEDRLAVSVGQFLSAVCPEQVVLRRKRKRGLATRGTSKKESP